MRHQAFAHLNCTKVVWLSLLVLPRLLQRNCAFPSSCWLQVGSWAQVPAEVQACKGCGHLIDSQICGMAPAMRKTRAILVLVFLLMVAKPQQTGFVRNFPVRKAVPAMPAVAVALLVDMPKAEAQDQAFYADYFWTPLGFIFGSFFVLYGFGGSCGTFTTRKLSRWRLRREQSLVCSWSACTTGNKPNMLKPWLSRWLRREQEERAGEFVALVAAACMYQLVQDYAPDDMIGWMLLWTLARNWNLKTGSKSRGCC